MNHNGLLLLPTENQVMSHNAMIEGDQCTQLRSQQLDCFLSQLENTKQTPLSEHCVSAFAMSLHGSANLRHLSPTGVAISQSQHAAHAHTHMTEYDFSGLQPISFSLPFPDWVFWDGVVTHTCPYLDSTSALPNPSQRPSDRMLVH